VGTYIIYFDLYPVRQFRKVRIDWHLLWFLHIYIPRLLTFFDNFHTGVKLFKEPLKVEIVVTGTLRVTAGVQMEMV